METICIYLGDLIPNLKQVLEKTEIDYKHYCNNFPEYMNKMCQALISKSSSKGISAVRKHEVFKIACAPLAHSIDLSTKQKVFKKKHAEQTLCKFITAVVLLVQKGLQKDHILALMVLPQKYEELRGVLGQNIKWIFEVLIPEIESDVGSLANSESGVAPPEDYQALLQALQLESDLNPNQSLPPTQPSYPPEDNYQERPNKRHCSRDIRETNGEHHINPQPDLPPTSTRQNLTHFPQGQQHSLELLKMLFEHLPDHEQFNFCVWIMRAAFLSNQSLSPN